MFGNQRTESVSVFCYRILASGQSPRFSDNYCSDILLSDNRVEFVGETRRIRHNRVREAYSASLVRESETDSLAPVINTEISHVLKCMI